MEKYIIKDDETNVRTYLHAAIYKHACTCEGKELHCANILCYDSVCYLGYFRVSKMKKTLDLFSGLAPIYNRYSKP